MSEPKTKYTLKVVFSPEHAQAITKICGVRNLKPEVFVWQAALNALTVAMLAGGLPVTDQEELREWTV